jgi:hypothetical protein
MATSRFLKTAKLGIILQITEIPPSVDGRAWEVHDVERNRGFRVTLAPQATSKRVSGRKPTDDDIDGAIGLAIERSLVSPPEKVSGALYDVEVTSQDFSDFAEHSQA